jgi:phosphoribosyl 1,2-cyclic phosphate phosphodiesterase
LKITFLGTGTSLGTPVIACNCPVCKSKNPKDKRLRSSVMIEIKDNVFIIDVGPDFRQQMLREKVTNLDALILTHEHIDHVGGLDDIRAFNLFLQKPIDIYARQRVLESIKKEFFYVFDKNRYPGVPKVNLHIVENKTFTINNIKITPVDVLHYHLNIFGYRIDDFTYITDASYISKKEKEKIKGSKIIVLNALRKKEHYSHFSLSQSVEILKELKPEKGFLTHISHQMGFHNEVEKKLPDFIHLAYDGLKFKI